MHGAVSTGNAPMHQRCYLDMCVDFVHMDTACITLWCTLPWQLGTTVATTTGTGNGPETERPGIHHWTTKHTDMCFPTARSRLAKRYTTGSGAHIATVTWRSRLWRLILECLAAITNTNNYRVHRANGRRPWNMLDGTC